MEDYYVARIVFTILTMVHFIVGCLKFLIPSTTHINRRTFLIAKWTEFTAIVAYIIYDNINEPYHGDWTLPIIFYLIIFASFFIMWWSYDKYTWLEKNKCYEMVVGKGGEPLIKNKIGSIIRETYYRTGYIRTEFGSIKVYIQENKEKPYTENSPIKVKFAMVNKDDYIIVEPW